MSDFGPCGFKSTLSPSFLIPSVAWVKEKGITKIETRSGNNKIVLKYLTLKNIEVRMIKVKKREIKLK